MGIGRFNLVRADTDEVVGHVTWVGTWERGAWEFIVEPSVPADERQGWKDRFDDAVRYAKASSMAQMPYRDWDGELVLAWHGWYGTLMAVRNAVDARGMQVDWASIVPPEVKALDVVSDVDEAPPGTPTRAEEVDAIIEGMERERIAQAGRSL